MSDRSAQKKRTRAALLAAARQLMGDGLPVTVTAAAARACVSKATAYRYFSDPAVLTAEAVLDFEARPMDALLAGLSGVRERVHRVAWYYRAFARDQEAAFRLFLAKTLEGWVSSGGGTVRRRGARRIPAFEAALAPARHRLSAGAFRDLVLALSGATGIEQHIAFADVCRLPPDEADRIGRIVTDAILDRFLGPDTDPA